MTALVNTCWKNGVWADPVWGAGVWASAGSPPVVTSTRPSPKQGGWQGHTLRERMKRHRARETELAAEREQIFKKLSGETQQAYVEVRKERQVLPDFVLAPVKQAIKPFASQKGIPQAKDIDWARLVLRGLDETVEALSDAMAKKQQARKEQFEREISRLNEQLQAVEKEHARVIRELEELDDEEAIELILQHLS